MPSKTASRHWVNNQGKSLISYAHLMCERREVFLAISEDENGDKVTIILKYDS